MREKLMRFMQGRYGTDRLNRFLMVLALVFLVISFLGGRGFYLGALALLGWSYFRMFSRNIAKRAAEYRARCFFQKQKNNLVQRKTHHIYRCPGCRQKIRVPRGRGRIAIRCQKCGTEFIRRS